MAQWRLTLDFSGRNVWAVLTNGTTQRLDIRVDGHNPSEIPDLYGFTGTSGCFGRSFWPAFSTIGSSARLLEEDWTLTLLQMANDGTFYRFKVEGSVTGPDGEGSNKADFVSKSRRVVITQRDMNMGLAVLFTKEIPPVGFQVKWRSEARFKSSIHPAEIADSTGTFALSIAKGLQDRSHRLELIASEHPGDGIAAIRVFSPNARSFAAQNR